MHRVSKIDFALEQVWVHFIFPRNGFDPCGLHSV